MRCISLQLAMAHSVFFLQGAEKVPPQVGDPGMLLVACAETIRDAQDALQTLQLLSARWNLRTSRLQIGERAQFCPFFKASVARPKP